MAEFGDDLRAALGRLAQRPKRTLPVMYDHLTWYERKEVREEYIELQKGLCWYCHERLDGPAHARVLKLPLDQRLWGPAFMKHPVHLHHNHKTGLTIGSTHAYCNAVLAQYHGE